MCAIIGWAGKLPKGLLTRLLVASEARGRDSTGVSFRTLDESGKPSNLCYRQVVPARTFVELHKSFMSDARRAPRGLAHTRRASPGMPVDNLNAHPYTWPYQPYGRYLFAHNGRIENWVDIKAKWLDQYSNELNAKVAEVVELLKPIDETVTPEFLLKVLRDCVAGALVKDDKGGEKIKCLPLPTIWSTDSTAAVLKDLLAHFSRTYYFEIATTDSMVLGPHVENRDFSNLVGCMAVVWMKADKVFTYRCAKEAIVANIIWKYKKPADGESKDDQMLTVVSSTPEIIVDSIGKLVDIEVDYAFSDIREGTVYEITPTGIESQGSVPSPVGHEDKFTSDVVEGPDGAPIAE